VGGWVSARNAPSLGPCRQRDFSNRSGHVARNQDEEQRLGPPAPPSRTGIALPVARKIDGSGPLGRESDLNSGFLLRHDTSYHDRPRGRKENRTGWPGIGNYRRSASERPALAWLLFKMTFGQRAAMANTPSRIRVSAAREAIDDQRGELPPSWRAPSR
jgi:hypothetical protein